MDATEIHLYHRGADQSKKIPLLLGGVESIYSFLHFMIKVNLKYVSTFSVGCNVWRRTLFYWWLLFVTFDF